MRWLVSTLCAFAISFMPDMAHADTPFWGERDALLYVTETKLAGRSGPQSLCAHVTDRHVFSVRIGRKHGHYAFSDQFCATEDLLPIPEGRFTMLQEAGLIPTGIPATPNIPLTWTLREKRLVALTAIAAIALPAFIGRRRRLRARRLRQISDDPIFYDVLASIMFHTARKDGVVDDHDVTILRLTFQELTGKPPASELVAFKSAEVLTDETILNLAKRYRGKEAEVLIDAAILVAARKGSVSPEKLKLLKKLNDALERDPSWFQEALGGAKKTSTPQNV